MWHDAFAYQGPVGEMDWDDEFTAPPMYEQLGKVLDSVGNPRPIEWVTTDDGYQVRISAYEAQTILNSVNKVPSKERLNYLKKLQNSEGLCKAIELIRGFDNEN